MPERDPQNLNFYWATLFVRTLFAQGVREVVISPGSRSTPLTLAFAAHPGMQTHIAIDERSGAFLALGLSKAKDFPACLVCTSGTAVANYYPAIIEATQTGVPMIVLSADRPPHLRNIGASQTIDQIKIFGDYPVFFHEVGEPKESNNGILRLEQSAKQAVRFSLQRNGVSHLNFPFSKPFEPDSEFLELVESDNEKLAKKSTRPFEVKASAAQLDEKLWKLISSASTPVIIAGTDIGTDQADSVSDLAKLMNAPILIEPGANIPSSKHTITGFDGFLRSKDISEELTPDLILRFGREPISKALQNYLSKFADVTQIRFMNEFYWGDENLTSTYILSVKGAFDVPEISVNPNKDWIRAWRKHQKEYYAFKEQLMFPTTPLTDGYVFHTISPRLLSKTFMMLSNSFPVRDLSLFGEYDGQHIFLNRGAAGIDGILSTTVGLSKGLNKMGILFIGDIAFLHDSNALMYLSEVQQTLLIYVLNNGGGSIFKMLPINEYKKKYSRFFETPHNVSIAALCRAHKVKHTLITRPEQLIPGFESNIERSGAHIFECITDGESSMEMRHKLWNYTPQKA